MAHKVRMCFIFLNDYFIKGYARTNMLFSIFTSWIPQIFAFFWHFMKKLDALKHFSNFTQHPIKMEISCYCVMVRFFKTAQADLSTVEMPFILMKDYVIFKYY